MLEENHRTMIESNVGTAIPVKWKCSCYRHCFRNNYKVNCKIPAHLKLIHIIVLLLVTEGFIKGRNKHTWRHN